MNKGVLSQLDCNKMKLEKENSYDSFDSPKKSMRCTEPSSGASANEDTFNPVECTSEFCELSDTKYCLENSDNKDAITSRIFIENPSKNQAKVLDIFNNNGMELSKLIDSLKCFLCHDMLDED